MNNKKIISVIAVILAVLMLVMLVVGILPASVFAEGDFSVTQMILSPGFASTAGRGSFFRLCRPDFPPGTEKNREKEGKNTNPA